MARQTYDGKVQWVVVADEDPGEIVDSRIQLIRTEKRRGISIGRNLRAGIPAVDGEKVLIIEDDDWYGPGYVAEMARRLERQSLVGCSETWHYNVAHSGWRRHKPKPSYACLFQTGFRRELLPLLDKIAKRWLMIDKRFWRAVPPRQLELFRSVPLAIGIKGLPGRSGAGQLHDRLRGMAYDPDREVLESWIGGDAAYYQQFQTDEKKPTRRRKPARDR
jgi:hypothetical protein